MPQNNKQKTVRKAEGISRCFCLEIWRIFQCFCRKLCRKLNGNSLYFSSFFMMIFNNNVCRDVQGLWNVSQRNRLTLVRTATRQFNAENEVFKTVLAKIWKKLLVRTRCLMRVHEKCALRICICAFFPLCFARKKRLRKIAKNAS